MGRSNESTFQLLAILSLGMLAFPVFSFWLALYYQNVLRYDSLETGVHLLPMIIMGILINILAALILHKVSNKLLMGIGAFAYTAAFVLVGVNRYGDSYWAFSFPALCLCVVGADFEFNVANVRHSVLFNSEVYANSVLKDVRPVFAPSFSPINRRLARPNPLPHLHSRGLRHRDSYLQ